MAQPNYNSPEITADLAELIKTAKAAGALETILLRTSRNTVIFYSDPTLTSLETLDQFDELHITHKKTARLLIAIFPES